MSPTAVFDAADFRAQSARFRDWCTFATGLIAVGLLFQHGLSPAIAIVRSGDLTVMEIVSRMLREAAAAGAAIFYACGLWALRGTFARLATGVRFEPAVARGLAQAGGDLIWGAVTAVAITPNILIWTDGSPGGFAFRPDDPAVVIGFVGGALSLLARLFSRAAAQEAELGEFI